jgi:hypothetical protein
MLSIIGSIGVRSLMQQSQCRLVVLYVDGRQERQVTLSLLNVSPDEPG